MCRRGMRCPERLDAALLSKSEDLHEPLDNDASMDQGHVSSTATYIHIFMTMVVRGSVYHILGWSFRNAR